MKKLKEKESERFVVNLVETKVLHNLKIGTKDEIVKNKYTGVCCTLQPVQFAIFNCILACLRFYKTGFYKNAIIQLLVALEDYFEMKWPKEYKLLTTNCDKRQMGCLELKTNKLENGSRPLIVLNEYQLRKKVGKSMIFISGRPIPH